MGSTFGTLSTVVTGRDNQKIRTGIILAVILVEIGIVCALLWENCLETHLDSIADARALELSRHSKQF
jgi:HAMP domain-containing protein